MTTTIDDQALTVAEPRSIGELSVDDLVQQVSKIQHIMRAVMRQDEHYGVIPGTGNKPSLLKPGAEKLGFTFRLAPRFREDVRDMADGHREYQVTCELIHIPTGTFVGEGVGSCSTMEGKYQYRWEDTGRPVPSAYWEARDPALLGGPQFTTRKRDGKWLIFHRVEHDNPADYYNTCLKMAKKRAHVDAILTATAASDIFTQDVEDLPIAETTPAAASEQQDKPAPPIQEPRRASTGQAAGVNQETTAQVAEIRMLLEREFGDGAEQTMADLSAFTGTDGKERRVRTWGELERVKSAKWVAGILRKALEKCTDAMDPPDPPEMIGGEPGSNG